MDNILGTWRAQKSGSTWQIMDEKGQLIATVADIVDAEANARQISANPYLLEALKSMVELIGDEDLPDNGELSGAAVCDMARTAVEMASKV